MLGWTESRANMLPMLLGCSDCAMVAEFRVLMHLSLGQALCLFWVGGLEGESLV